MNRAVLSLVVIGLGLGAVSGDLAQAAPHRAKKAEQQASARKPADLAKQHPSAEEITSADFVPNRPSRALLARTQILLDRARYSPGVIDGMPGDNFDNALKAYKKARGLPEDPTLDAATWRQLSGGDQEPAMVDYTITDEDVAGPFVEKIPRKMEDQAKLPRLGYTEPAELLSERFHMGEGFLKDLNGGKDLKAAGTVIKVANVVRDLDPTDPKTAGRKIAQTKKQDPDRPKVARIVVDKPGHALSAFDKDGNLLGFYPASIGSSEKPAPSGTLKVVRVVPNPTYTYNPKYGFKGVTSAKPFEIKPGPNNPVGAVWIQLTGEGYGIHGTPEPEKVGKTASHGCVRLTNWNALALAAMVDKDVPVEFGD